MDRTATHNTFIPSFHGFHEAVLIGIQANKSRMIHTLAAIHMKTNNHRLCTITHFERYPKAAHHNNKLIARTENGLNPVERIQ